MVAREDTNKHQKQRDDSREPHQQRHSSSERSREKRRHRSPSPSPSSRRHRHRSSSPSPQRSSSGRHRHSRSSSSSRRHHHSSSHKKRHRSPSTDYSSSSSEDDSRERRHHKKHKKDRKHKKSKKKSSKKHKKSKLGAVGDEWGKYGIIHEADIFTKEAEFQAWLIDIKKANVETLGNVKRKQMFIDFMEDYNTATMPHEKYYNLAKWEERDRALRMGEPLPSSDSSFNIKNDEEKLRLEHKRAAAAVNKVPKLEMSRDQLEALTKVNRERVELDRMRKMGLKTKNSLGVRYDEHYE